MLDEWFNIQVIPSNEQNAKGFVSKHNSLNQCIRCTDNSSRNIPWKSMSVQIILQPHCKQFNTCDSIALLIYISF